MENKELQELFAAKRTTEANRRRQEKLAAMINAKSNRTRPLWPLWALSAAAGLALVLITLPSLFLSEAEEPLLVAEVEIEAIDTTEATDTIDSIHSIHPPVSPKPATRPAPTEIAAIVEPVVESVVEPEVYEPIAPVIVESAVQEQEPAAPRIHRRTSSRMVCSNCSIHNDPFPSTAFQDFLAATFGTAANTPIPLKTIEF